MKMRTLWSPPSCGRQTYRLGEYPGLLKTEITIIFDSAITLPEAPQTLVNKSFKADRTQHLLILPHVVQGLENATSEEPISLKGFGENVVNLTTILDPTKTTIIGVNISFTGNTSNPPFFLNETCTNVLLYPAQV
ncbi:hypothetical protein PHLCEN_2v11106 [Hermanssonia centrifuga]|uniref:Uncharacterized protein n=1 Tax=Hermanssonia centrifuga TaxID=98765 RepID=A0A2R6NLW1_9APHY|nr:hypothetical protein PHLCEN_2v11106 [Hermanssonia centrifuga]